MNYAHFFWRNLCMRFKVLLEYRTSLYFMIAGRASNMVVTLLFWGTIYQFTSDINGWSIGQVVLLQAFYSLFTALNWFFFDFTDYMDKLTLYGGLDSMITKPVNPIIAFMLANMSFLSFTAVIESALLFFIALQVGASISLLGFAAGFIIVLLASLLMALIMTAAGFMGFWIGRTEALMNIWDTLYLTSKYPVTVYPDTMRLLLTVGMPIAFMQSYPAMVASESIGSGLFVNVLIAELLLIVFWFSICILLWRAGLKRYGSYGG